MFIRCWYSGATGNNITKQYSANESGDIELKDDDDYQVADIYRAYKVIAMIF